MPSQRARERGRARDIRAAARFAWHLEPPWKTQFKHEHWWRKHPAAASQEAVIWEILRRHPTTEHLIDSKGESAPTSLRQCPFVRAFFAKHGLKSWQNLSPDELQDCLEAVSAIMPQRGLIPNAESVGVIGGPDDPDKRLFSEIRKLSLRHTNSLQRGNEEDEASIEQAEELWENLHQKAFHYIRQGHVLISFDPLMPRVETMVAQSVQRIISRAQAGRARTAGRTRSRARCEDWLRAIDRFETAELNRPRNVRRDDQLFASYRRMFNGFDF